RDGKGRVARVESIGYDKGNAQTPHLLWRYEYEDAGTQPVRVIGPSINPAGDYVAELKRLSKDRFIVAGTGFAPRPDGSFYPIARCYRMERHQGGGTLFRGGAELSRVAQDSHGWLRDVRLPDGGRLSVTKRDKAGRPVRVETDR